MRRIFLLLFTVISLSASAQSAFEGVFGFGTVLDINPLWNEYLLDKLYSEEEKKKLLLKQYLTPAYNPALIDEFTTQAFFKIQLVQRSNGVCKE